MNIESLRKQFIESSIIGLEKKIFVLKGYEFFHDISLPKLFDSTKSVQEIIIDLNYNLNNKDETYYIHFSDFFILDSMQILGLLSITDRFQLLDFNLFQGYYFSNETVDAKFIINEYESNTESILQRQFGVLDYLDNIAGVMYKYNEINLSSIKFTEHLFQKTNQELSITDIPQSNLNVANIKDVEILTFNFTPNQIISYFLSLNDNEISYFSFDGNIENNTISKMIISLYLIGYKIEFVKWR